MNHRICVPRRFCGITFFPPGRFRGAASCDENDDTDDDETITSCKRILVSRKKREPGPMRLGSHEINLVESRLHSLQEFKQADSRSLARDFTKFTDRRGALASVATTEDLSSQRSAKPKASLALSLVCHPEEYKRSAYKKTV